MGGTAGGSSQNRRSGGPVVGGLAQHRLDGGFERREVSLHRAPDERVIKAVVTVTENVPDPGEDVLEAGAGIEERHERTSMASRRTRCQMRGRSRLRSGEANSTAPE
jgi:hypothetical protein